MTLPKGLVQVYTGMGKGKTTAAVGLSVRARGAGLDVLFVQFVKGGAMSSELALLRQLGVEVIRPARASTGLLAEGITEEDRAAAAEAWAAARKGMRAGGWDVVVLDEVNVALRHGLIDLDEFLETLAARSETVEVVCTGRGAPPDLVEVADLVTDMRQLKHPFEDGVLARFGIEY